MQLRCELRIAAVLNVSEKAALTFSLINAGSQPLQVLSWQTPFEGIAAPMFTVERNGAVVDYRGRMVKRGAPTLESYVALQPGERRQATVDLADGWDVAMAGTYTVEYIGELLDVVSGAVQQRSLDDLKPMPLRCTPVTFKRS